VSGTVASGAVDRAEAFSTFAGTVAEVLDIDPSEVVPEARWREDLDADSLAVVEITLALNEAFDIKLPDGDGSEVYRKACKFNPDARTVLTTGEVVDRLGLRKGVRVIAAADPDPTLLAHARDSLGIRRLYPSWEEMLAKEDVQYLQVNLSPNRRVDLVILSQ